MFRHKHNAWTQGRTRMRKSTCESCWNEFDDFHAYGSRNTRFCSWACYQEHHRIKPKECPHCGATFKPVSSSKQFCSKKCRYEAATTNGHRYVAGNGYVYIKLHDHPEAKSGRGYVLEHRVVAELKIGRRLRRGEAVHHLNRIRTDNRPENLEVVESNSAHQKLHRGTKRLNTCQAVIKRSYTKYGRGPLSGKHVNCVLSRPCVHGPEQPARIDCEWDQAA